MQLNLRTGSVVIGHSAKAEKDKNNSGEKVVAIGDGATSVGVQGVAIGNNTQASSQSTALGSDVFAIGKSSIAIGNDDIASQYRDELSDRYLLANINGRANENDLFKELRAVLDDGYFDRTYVAKSGTDNKRIYSPTYSRGVGAIAIGSRAVAYGNGSTTVGTLSFALADQSTAIGLRSFVEKSAIGGTAIGESSRVFAVNSIAVGNNTESSAQGSFSYGYNAKAVGRGSIAFGYGSVAAARLDDTLYRGFEQRLAGIHSIQLFNEDGSTNSDNQNLFRQQVETLIQGQDAANTKLKSGQTLTAAERAQVGVDTWIDTGGLFQYDDEVYLTVGGKSIKKTSVGGAALQDDKTNSAENTIAIGRYAFALRSNALAVGYATVSDARSSLAIGSYSHTTMRSENAVALGVNAYVDAANAFVGGYSAKSFSKDSLAIGTGASVGQKLTKAEADKLVADTRNLPEGSRYKIITGNDIDTTDSPSIIKETVSGQDIYRLNARNAAAVGKLAKATAVNALAFGNFSEANLVNSMALGVSSQTDYSLEDLAQPGWVARGAISIPTSGRTGVISVGSKGYERRIVNVASGYKDTDAVNVAQLRAVDEKFDTALDALQGGGGSQYLSLEKTNPTGEAGKLSAILKRSGNYEKYVNLKEQSLFFAARAKLNDENFNQEALNNLNNKISELGSADNNLAQNTATSLKAIERELTQLQTSNLTASQKKQKLDDFLERIVTAAIQDSGRNIGGLTQEQIAAKKQGNNYLNDGAKGDDSIALGWKASTAATTGNQDSQLGGKRAIAIGFEAKANAQNAIAIGTANTVEGNKSIAIGYNHTVRGNNSGTFGDPNVINYSNSYAVGNNVTIGGGAEADNSKDGSFVIGNYVDVTADKVFVLGGGSATTSRLAANLAESVYLGYRTGTVGGVRINTADPLTDDTGDAQRSRQVLDGANGLTGNAIPYGSILLNGITFDGFNGASPISVASIGHNDYARLLQGVAAGTISKTSTDAINGSQLYSVAKKLSQESRWINVNSTREATNPGNDNYSKDFSGATGSNSIVIGKNAIATQSDTIAIGRTTNVSGTQSVAIGYNHTVRGNNSGTFGGNPNIINYSNSYAIGNNITIGDDSTTNNDAYGSFVIGRNVKVTADKVFVLGGGEDSNEKLLTAGLAESVYLGIKTRLVSGVRIDTTQPLTDDTGKDDQGNPTRSRQVLDGADGLTGKAIPYASILLNGITFGNFAGPSPVSVVSIGRDDYARILQGVAAGTISKTSTDAINGSQLYSTNKILSLLATSLESKIGTSATLTKTGDNVGTISLGSDFAGTSKSTIEEAIKASQEEVAVADSTNPLISVSTGTTTDGATKYLISANVASTIANEANGNLNKLATAQAVYSAVSGAKADVKLTTDDENILSLNGTKTSGLESDTFTLTFSKAKLLESLKENDGLGNTFVKVDGSNLPDKTTNTTAYNTWRTALGIGDGVNWFNVKQEKPTDLAGSNYDKEHTGALGDKSIAIGPYASVAVDATAGLALGYQAKANLTNSIAIGNNVAANALDMIAIGSDITATVTALPNSGENKEGRQFTIAIGRQAGSSSDGKVNSLGSNAIAIGANSYASELATVSLGASTGATGSFATALGSRAVASGKDATALGSKSIAEALSSVAIGGARVIETKGEDGSITKTASYALAFGANARAQANNAIAIGASAVAADEQSIALGSGSTTAKAVSTKEATIEGLNFKNFAGTSPSSTVSIGGASLERTITNVAAGRVTKDSTDAINGSQLYATNSILGKLAKSVKDKFGGNVELDVDTGGVTFTNIGETNKDNINDAIKAVREVVEAAADSGLVVTPSDETSGAKKYTVKINDDLKAKIDNLPANVTDELAKKANKTLDNLTDAGKTVITDLVDIQKKDGSIDGLTIESSVDDATKKKTFKVGITEEAIKQAAGTTNLATDYAKADASNISNGNITKWQDKLGAIQFTGDNNDKSKSVKLGEAIKIYGQSSSENAQQDYTKNNIQVFGGENGLFIQLAKNLSGLGTVTADTVAATTFKLGNANNAPTLTADNGNIKVSDGAKITNLTKGVEDKDAATVEQVNDVTLAFTTDSKTTGTTDTTTAVKGKVKLSEQSLALNGTDGYITTSTTENSQAVTIDLAQTLKTKLGKLDNLADDANGTYATKDEIKNLSSTLNFDGDNKSSTDSTPTSGSVDLKKQRFAVKGTKDEIETTATGQNLTIKLAEAITNKLKEIDKKANKTDVDAKADTGLGNLTDAGKEVITGLVDIVRKAGSSEKLTVSSKVDKTSKVKTFEINLDDSNYANISLSNIDNTAKDTITGLVSGELKSGNSNKYLTVENTGGSNGAAKKIVVGLSDDAITKLDKIDTSIEKTANAKQIIALGGNSNSTTNNQTLDQAGGIKFDILGDGTDIKTTASENKVSISLAKATTVSDGENKVVTSGAVYTALNNAKTELTNKGLVFAADSGTATTRKLGETLAIKGQSGYIQTKSEDGKIVVELTDAAKTKLDNVSDGKTVNTNQTIALVDQTGTASKTQTLDVDGGIKLKIANGDESIVTEADATTSTVKVKVKDGGIDTAKLANNAVTKDKLADDAVETSKIKDGAVTTAKLANDAVTKDKLANDAVETSKIKNSAVTGDKIANGAITAEKLAPEFKTNVEKAIALKDQKITLTGDSDSKTDDQTLGQEGGISFAINGNDDIATNASGAKVDLSINKNTVIDETNKTSTRVATTKAVYDAILAAKAVVEAKADVAGADNLIEVEKVAGTGIAKDTFKVSLTKENLVTNLADTFAKKDATGLSDDDIAKWKKALSIENVSNTSSLTYRANSTADANAKTVAFDKGLDFIGDKNITTSIEDEGKVKFALKDTLTGITNITNGSKVDETGVTTLNISDAGLTLNDKNIKGVKAGVDDKDAVNVAQLKALENVVGKPGQNGVNGNQGPAGQDGTNGQSLFNQVDALRNGLAGTVVYTDKDGKRLISSDGNYYYSDVITAGYVKANNGKWYLASDVENGIPKAGKENSGQTLADLDTVYIGKAEGNKSQLVDASDVILSTVNADGTTIKPIQLANLASALGATLTSTLQKETTVPTSADADAIVANLLEGKAGKTTTSTDKLDMSRAVTVADL
ncbi:hypothetical protein QV06_09835 [Gallibacterium genomosp. 3]|uniref:Autotransporter adhesin n=1 Tax=Gallibacterium genomosp. 3 TaxID=505345 RepID=A0A1A7PNX0_9PAST|nr:hypothetical protein [Gallibacterium genomosp. 3]OBX03446.1 hypothetical protein QV06_09835 [Gallibacterium genomosp. 3]